MEFIPVATSPRGCSSSFPNHPTRFVLFCDRSIYYASFNKLDILSDGYSYILGHASSRVGMRSVYDFSDSLVPRGCRIFRTELNLIVDGIDIWIGFLIAVFRNGHGFQDYFTLPRNRWRDVADFENLGISQNLRAAAAKLGRERNRS